MSISASVTNNPITATVGETKIDVAASSSSPTVAATVSGGFGPSGANGAAGAAATIAVGTVTTGAPGSSASVVNAGSSSAAVLNFTIPAGATGAAGATGPAGAKGDTGDTGVVSATSPLTYDATTKTVALTLPLSSTDVSGLPTAGTGSTNYCAGDDSRLSDARTPTNHKSTHATGGSDALSAADIGAVESNDVRLTNDRYPTAHASSHGAGGADAITIASSQITDFASAAAAAAPVQSGDPRLTDSRTPTGAAGGALNGTFPNPGIANGSITTATLANGAVTAEKLSATGISNTAFLRGDMTWASAGSTSASDLTSGTLAAARIGAHASSHQTGGSDAIAPTVASPSQITSNQNDYAGATADINRLSSDAARDITGFSGGADGKTILLVNVGSNTITLKHQSTSSTAANRIIVPWAADYILAADGAAVLVYDNTTSRWRVI